jgi:ComF family protein
MPTTWLEDWSLTLKNLVWPQFCKVCGRRILTEDNVFFCPTCWELSARVVRPFCTVCGRPHEGMIGYGAQDNFPCAPCRESPPKHLRRIYGAAVYEDAVGMAVRLFKFRDKPHLAAPLGELMREFAALEMDANGYDAIVPVPLHTVRRRARGYNQSELLAREVLPVFPNASLDLSLARIRPTRTQSRLKDARDRRGNMQGAFAVSGDSLNGKRVLLIDDVVTTSTTVSECARALRLAGAKEVDVLCAALATLQRHLADG